MSELTTIEGLPQGINKVLQLFRYLQALDQLRNPVKQEVNEQLWLLWMNELPDNPCIQLPQLADHDDKTDHSPEDDGFVLRVKKPLLSDAPNPPVLLFSWLEKGWQDVNGSIRVVTHKEKNIPSQEVQFSDRQELTSKLQVWLTELKAWREHGQGSKPEPDAELLPWLEGDWKREEDKELGSPRTKSFLLEPAKTIIIRFDDDSERIQLLATWKATWETWVERERPVRVVMDIFTRIYNLFARFEREGEEIELILGDGILEWDEPTLHIHHPLILQRLRLEFDPSVPEFTLFETEQASELYSSVLRIIPNLMPGIIGRLRDDLVAGDWHPLGSSETDEFLKRTIIHLSPQGTFLSDRCAKKPRQGPVIRRDPVIYLRKRNLGFSSALESIIQDLPMRKDLPAFIKHVVGLYGEEKERATGSAGIEVGMSRIDPNGEDEYILLSKEANAEQLVIAQRLEKSGAVLVQGPPGTGKTHTIANLIGHLLAQGKSILVTSHTSKALQILHDKVVEPLKPLCISRLSDDNRHQMNSAIDGITERLSNSDPDVLEREAEQLQRQRVVLLAHIRAARQKLLLARHDEYRSLVVAGTELSPAEAARFIKSNQAGNDWIPSPVRLGEPLPLSHSELSELYQTNEVMTLEDEQYLEGLLLTPDELLQPADFEELVEQRKQLREKTMDQGKHLWDDRVSLQPEQLKQLEKRILQCILVLDDPSSWTLQTLSASLDSSEVRGIWDDLIEQIEKVVEQAYQFKKIELEFAPLYKAEPDEDSDEIEGILTEICEYLRQGGRLFHLKILAKRKWKTVFERCQINGRSPAKTEHYKALIDHVRLEKARRKLVTRWLRQLPDGPGVEQGGREPEQMLNQYCPLIRRNLDWSEGQWQPLQQQLCHFGFVWEDFYSEVPPQGGNHGRLFRLKNAISSHLPEIIQAKGHRLSLTSVEIRLASLIARLESQSKTSTVIWRLAQAAKENDAKNYQKTFNRLVELNAKQHILVYRKSLLAKVESVAPAWASDLRLRIGVHGKGVLPGEPDQAWLLRQLTDELNARGNTSLPDLQAQLEKLSRDLRQLTGHLVEKRAWAAQSRRTTRTQRQALHGWRELLGKYGKGTGKRATKLLAQARELMPICQSAVPVWIMPLSRVVESFDPSVNHFDVVIIDEASQADAMALITLYMARQVIIVGDHEQVSPVDVGRNLDDLQKLIDEYLKGIPNSQLFDGQFSIYALARTTFQATCLREHFRCVMPIIQFSNFLSYEGKILPLRDESMVEVKPATVAYRVEGATSRGKTNEKEAQAITSLIAACIEQMEYREATFGVISMLGDEQAMQIERLLQRFIPPIEYQARKIQCGNSAHFQGDERTVIFLTMVDGPNENPPLRLRQYGAQDMYKKRFNVAASRARDQMWVVHSLNPDVDLQAGDLRLRLIRHAEDPLALVRSLEKQEQQTESEFERLVLRRLHMAGYKVKPQWKVGGFRIDMVVEGGGKRLAVECDGDRFHTLENLSEDLSRQAILERLGWTFERIRGSEFFRNPDEAMQAVFARLEAMEIPPEGQESEPAEASEVGNELKERVIRRAAELRREWGFEQDPNGDADEHELFSDITEQEGDLVLNTHASADDASIEVPEEQALSVKGSENVVNVEQRVMSLKSTSPIENIKDNSTINNVTDQNSSTGVFNLKRLQREWSLIASSTSPFEIIDFLLGQGLEIADKRNKEGALWVIGGLEMEPLMKVLRQKGYRFTYSARGGKASSHHPAWFCAQKEAFEHDSR